MASMISDKGEVVSFRKLRPSLSLSPKSAFRNKETSVGSLGLVSELSVPSSVPFSVGADAGGAALGNELKIDCTDSGLSFVPGKNFSLNVPGLIFGSSRSREKRERLSGPLCSRCDRKLSNDGPPLSFEDKDEDREEDKEDDKGERSGEADLVGEFAKKSDTMRLISSPDSFRGYLVFRNGRGADSLRARDGGGFLLSSFADELRAANRCRILPVTLPVSFLRCLAYRVGVLVSMSVLVKNVVLLFF